MTRKKKIILVFTILIIVMNNAMAIKDRNNSTYTMNNYNYSDHYKHYFLSLNQFNITNKCANLQENEDTIHSRIIEGISETSQFDNSTVSPFIQINLFARNTTSILPYFLSQFQQLSYPKNHITLFIQLDTCNSQSSRLFHAWIEENRKIYYNISKNDFCHKNYRSKLAEEKDSKIREEALIEARKNKVQYAFFLNTDVLITDLNLITNLMKENKKIAAPLLETFDGDYNLNYLPSDPLFSSRNEIGCRRTLFVHSCILIDLQDEKTKNLTFIDSKLGTRSREVRATFTFGRSAKLCGLDIYICNQEYFGIYPTFRTEVSDQQTSDDIRLSALVHGNISNIPTVLSNYVLKKSNLDKVGLDELFYINLENRPERKRKMEHKFEILGINATRISATNGRTISDKYANDLNIMMLKQYKNPYNESVGLTKGEIGCFLSHYFLWKLVIKEKYKRVLILEDDIAFNSNFRSQILRLGQDLSQHNISWDLIFIGRHKLHNYEHERPVPGSSLVVQASYSDWTIGYLLSATGAGKLVSGIPLSKMVPVDIYIGAMADTLPSDWKYHYGPRALKVLAAEPPFIRPSSIQSMDSDWSSDTQS